MSTPSPVAPDANGRPHRWQRYPKYKLSGVECLGEVPEGWENKKIKYVSSLNSDALGEDTPLNYELKYVDISSVDSVKGIIQTEDFIFEKAPSRARRKVQNGDIIISTVRTYLKAIAPIINPEPNLIVSTGFAVIHPIKDLQSHFASFAFTAPYFIENVVANSTGVSYPAINASEIGNMKITVPPSSEQSAIAAFLDRETARIDALIEKKERQIALLQEKRAALISHAVTKGLNPSVPMKDSGVEWLGDVPEHYQVLPIKRFIKIRYGLGEPPKELETGLPLLRATNIDQGKIIDEGMVYVDPNDVPASRDAYLRENEIIIVRSGANTGDSTIVPERYVGAVSGYDMVVTVNKGVPDYFAWQFLTAEIRNLQFGFHKLRAAQPHLNAEELGSTLFVIPPQGEQESISAYIKQKTDRIDSTHLKIFVSITKLHEYRTSIISAAVTGKIDVRQEAKA